MSLPEATQVTNSKNESIQTTVAGTPFLETDADNLRKLRIVHISDTHLNHEKYLEHIPPGDVIVHSGDFSQLRPTHVFKGWDYSHELQLIRDFFSKLPHKYKVFVAGNHEKNFVHHSVEDIQRALADHVVYLQDSSVVIEGVKFYGSPWNGIRAESSARAFAVPYCDLHKYWERMPSDIDVLVTHQPARLLLDFGKLRKGPFNEYFCDDCQTNHGNGFFHLGSDSLRTHIMQRIRPKLHLFGHVHEDFGIVTKEGIVFSNAALKLKDDLLPHVIDLYYKTDNPETQLMPVNCGEENVKSSCAIM